MIKLKDLPIGSKIKFGKYQVEDETSEDIIWLLIDKNHEGYPSNSGTLITEKIIDLRAIDAKEPDNPIAHRAAYGNNNYLESNIHQWLNSDKEDWYIPQHEYDAPPINDNLPLSGLTEYYNKQGFLNLFSKEDKKLLLDTELTSYMRDPYDSFINFYCKIFLLSRTEFNFPSSYSEGSSFSFFEEAMSKVGYVTEQCFNNTKSSSKPKTLETPWMYWTRSCSSSSSYGTCRSWRVSTGGNTTSTYDCYAGNYGIRPACNISLSNILTEKDSDDCYRIYSPKYILYKGK